MVAVIGEAPRDEGGRSGVASGSNSEVSKKKPAPRYAWEEGGGRGSIGGSAEAGRPRG